MKSAVLFLVFNRPETTRKVFEAIREYRPPRLYIAADGPRTDRSNEKELCTEVRSIVTNVDWPCDVKTLFREHNLGCKIGVSQGITWFFEHEEEGIILEDDVLPISSFFTFCEELLKYYRHDENIGLISGHNPVSAYCNIEESYCYSAYHFIWGWASWRRVWQHYDLTMQAWPEWRNSNGIEELFNYDKLTAIYFRNMLETSYKNKIESWEYPGMMSRWKKNMIGIVPQYNQITNLGYGGDSTNTSGSIPKCLIDSTPHSILTPLKHPNKIERNIELEKLVNKHFFGTHKYYEHILRNYIRNIPSLKRKLKFVQNLFHNLS